MIKQTRSQLWLQRRYYKRKFRILTWLALNAIPITSMDLAIAMQLED